jgi:small subunit ribosomal protein S6
MNKYEVYYVIDPTLADDKKEELITKFSDFVTKANGTVEKVDKQGVKKLAYNIKGKQEGFFVLMSFTSSIEVPKAMRDLMKITDGIMRTMFTRK